METPRPDIDLSIVIPAYNERDRIVPTIASIVAYLHNHAWTWELIVSDDGSTDDTASIVKRLDVPGVRLIGGHPNQGKGAAVRRGLQHAQGRAILVTDADMSTPIGELEPMLNQLGPATMVIGSRAHTGADVVGKSRSRQLMSDSLHLIVRYGLGIDIADTQCGFKLMGADVAQLLASEQTIDGFSFDLEWLFVAGRHRIAVLEHPVEWYDAPGSKVDPLRDSIRFVRDIARVRWSRRRRRRTDTEAISALPGDPATTRRAAPMHVGVVTSLPPSARTLNEYGLHLVTALGHQPEIARVTVFRDDTVSTARDIDRVESVPAWTPDSLANPVRILRAARRARVDAVLFNLQFATFGDRRIPAAIGLITPAVLRMCGIPTVVLLHNLVDTVDLQAAGFASASWKIKLYTAIGRGLTRMLLLANRVVVTLPTYHDILTNRYRASNVYLTPHGTFPHVPTHPPATTTRSILTFGKFGTYKRVEDLIEAFELVRAAGHHDVELVIAGTNAINSPGYLESVAARIDASVPVRFTGYVDEDDVPGLFERCEMVVFPYTSTTGSSGPLHQAGAAGRAAVLPAIGDFVEVIRDEGFTGEFFEPGDVMSLAGAINRLLDDDHRRTAIGQQNQRSARSLDIELIVGWHAMHLADVAH